MAWLPERKRGTKRREGQACTNNAQELFELLTNIVLGTNGQRMNSAARYSTVTLFARFLG